MIDVTIKLLSRSAEQDQFYIVQTQVVQVGADPVIVAPGVPAEFVGRDLMLEIVSRGGPVRFMIRGKNLATWPNRPTSVPFFTGRRISFAPVGMTPPDPDEAPAQVEAPAEQVEVVSG